MMKRGRPKQISKNDSINRVPLVEEVDFISSHLSDLKEEIEHIDNYRNKIQLSELDEEGKEKVDEKEVARRMKLRYELMEQKQTLLEKYVKVSGMVDFFHKYNEGKSNSKFRKGFENQTGSFDKIREKYNKNNK